MDFCLLCPLIESFHLLLAYWEEEGERERLIRLEKESFHRDEEIDGKKWIRAPFVGINMVSEMFMLGIYDE